MKQIDYLVAKNNSLVLDIAFELLASNHLPVILCVGKKNATDSFAKIVAELLIKKHSIKAYVYGRNTNPITNKNLESAMSFIKSKHKGSKVFVVSSTINNANVKSILYYGKGKTLIGDYSFGDYSFTGIFRSTPFLTAYEKQKKFALASFIARSLHLGVSYADAIKKYVTQKNTTA